MWRAWPLTDFMLFCLSKTDDVRLIASLCVSHVHDDAVEPAEQIDPLLAIRLPVIFPGEDRCVNDLTCPQPAIREVRQPGE